MSAREELRRAADELRRVGCPSPDVDAEWLLAHVLGVSRSELHADGRRVLDADEKRRFQQLVARRARREPLAYVLGEWGFRGLTLEVDSRVLVPRPETEVVVERCLELLGTVEEPHVLDIGIGSGSIALALAAEHPGALVVATDNSTAALEVAERNRARTGLAERVELVEGELFADLEGPFDLIVSNPPYVELHEFSELEPEVAEHEPRGALVAAGATEAIAEGARPRLGPGGWLVLETGDGKARGVAELLGRLGYEEVSIGADLGGQERVVVGRAPR